MSEITLSSEQRGRLHKYAAEFQRWLESPKGKSNIKEHRDHEAHFKKKLSQENIGKLSEDEFREVSYYFAEPVVIKKGEVQHFKAKPSIRTIDWKKAALASILNKRKPTIEDAVSLATEKSKEDFKSFCRFLENSTEFGHFCCTITFTGGRFRTKVKEEFLFKDVKVPISFERPVFLSNCISRWEILEPVKEQLITELTRDLKEIIKDLKEGLDVIKRPIDEQHLSQASKLRIDAWDRLRKVTYQPERRIRLALIEQEKGLKQDLTELFKHFSKYNRSIDGLMYLGEQRTEKHFQKVNAEREKLIPMTTEMSKRLSKLFSYPSIS